MGRQSGSTQTKRKHHYVDDAGFGATLVRHALFAVCKTMESESPRDGLNWLIGAYIVEFEQHGEDRNSDTIPNSECTQRGFPPIMVFSIRGLMYRQFFFCRRPVRP